MANIECNECGGDMVCISYRESEYNFSATYRCPFCGHRHYIDDVD